MKHLAVIVASLALSPCLCSAQVEDAVPDIDGGAQADPAKVDCVAILKKADQALTGVKTLTFQSRAYGIGGVAFRCPEVTGRVRLIRDADQLKEDRRRRKRDALGWLFDLKGEARRPADAKPYSLATAFDGATVRSIRENEKKVLEAGWEQADEPLHDGAGWTLTWLARWKPLVSDQFASTEGAPPTRFEGEALVEGEMCDVVYVDYSDRSPDLFDAWWYIARSDSLPRRVDLHFIDTGQGDGFVISTLSQLKVNEPIEKAALALATPEGYTVKTFEDPARRAAAPRPSGPAPGTPAPEWSLKDASGKEHTLAGYKGKVVVLDFWATWCGPCRVAMPAIQAIHEKYAEKGVAVLGMNCWESGDPAKYMTEQKFTYGLLLKADEAAAAYGVSGIPAIFVIGKDGKIAYQSVGFEGEEAVEAAVEKALGD